MIRILIKTLVYFFVFMIMTMILKIRATILVTPGNSKKKIENIDYKTR